MPSLRAVCLGLLLCSTGFRVQAESDSIVVLVSVDGLAHYYLDDPKADMPNLRKLAAEGARATMMKASLPTVTWPNHTTLVTGVNPGRHGVIGNSYFDRTKGEAVQLITDPVFDKVDLVTSPTIYDVAKQAGLKTASILWPATRGAPTLDWTLPEVSTQDLIDKYSTPGLLKEFSAAGIPQEKNLVWRSSPELGHDRDRLFLQMFTHVVRTKRPNLALLHLVDLDHVEHAHGPQTPEAYGTVAFEDGLIGEIWAMLQKDFAGKATLIVTSDHGFFGYRQQVQPNVLLRAAGLITTGVGGKIMSAKVRALAQGGSSFIYIMDDANPEALATRLAAQFKAVEGVGRVITRSDYPEFGLADPSKDPRMPDLILSSKEGYAFSDTAAGDEVVTTKSDTLKGTHGYDPNQSGMHATFVAWGQGIKPGANAGVISNTDVAPTVAKLLSITMPGTDGHVLEAVLAK